VKEQDWFKEWYRRMYQIYNSEWDSFLREYVFSKDPPFVIKPKTENPS